jgi:AcrR family transcriptional regulator
MPRESDAPSALPKGGHNKGAQTKSRVLAAADALHRRKPAALIKIAEIAALAGVSPALVIAQYKSKDELLFEAYLTWIESRLIPDAQAFLKEAPHAELNSLLTHYFVSLSHSLHRARDMMSTSYWWTMPEGRRYAETIAPLEAMVKACLRRACPHAAEDAIAEAEMLIQSAFESIVRRAGVEQLSLPQVEAMLAAACRRTLAGLSMAQADRRA